jgi:hypothetical protein
MKTYTIKSEIDLINPKAHTLSVSRKNITTKFTSELSVDELFARKEEVSMIIAKVLTDSGYMIFNTPEIKSIKEKKIKWN